jgi:hypothetical protein
MHAAAPMWRNGRRNGLKIHKRAIPLAASGYSQLHQLLGEIPLFRAILPINEA